MRLILLAILIAFPLAEIIVLVKLFSNYGIWVLFYLVVVAMLGLQLIKEEKLLFSGRFMQQMMQGSSPFKAMFGSARNIFAGILLLVPGVISDVLAAILLLIPVKTPANDQMHQGHHDFQASAHKSRQQTHGPSSNNQDYDVIEGEYKRED